MFVTLISFSLPSLQEKGCVFLGYPHNWAPTLPWSPTVLLRPLLEVSRDPPACDHGTSVTPTLLEGQRIASSLLSVVVRVKDSSLVFRRLSSTLSVTPAPSGRVKIEDPLEEICLGRVSHSDVLGSPVSLRDMNHL